MDIRRSFVERLAGPQGHGGLTVDLHQNGPFEHVYEHFGVVPVWQGGSSGQVCHRQHEHFVSALVESARQREVGVHSVERFQVGNSGPAGLVFGYGALDERGIAAGLARLRRVFGK